MSPLQRQNVEIVFAQGIETKLSKFQVPLGKMLTLQNAVFNSPGAYEKSNGTSVMTSNILGGDGDIWVTPIALFPREDELCLIAATALGNVSDTLFSYDTSNNAWSERGMMPSVGASVASVAQPQYSTYQPDMAIAANGLQCFVYELVDTNNSRTSHGIGYTVVDPATGQIVVPPSVVDSATTLGNPHVVAAGNIFICYYASTASSGILLGRTLDATVPTGGWSGSTTVTSGTTTLAIASTKTNFDVCVSANGATIYLAFFNRSGSTTTLLIAASSPFVVSSSATTATSGNSLSIFMDLNGNVALGIVSTNLAQFAVFSSSLSVVKAVTTVSTIGTNGACITGVCTSPGDLAFFWADTTSTNAMRVFFNTVSGTTYAAVGTVATLSKCMTIAAKAIVVGGLPYCPAWYSPNSVGGLLTRFLTPQNTVYLLDSTGVILSKALVGTAGGMDTISLLTFSTSPFYQLGSTYLNSTLNVISFSASASNILTSEVIREALGSSGQTQTLLNYQFGLSDVSMTFYAPSLYTPDLYQRQLLANTVHVNGGVLQMYDGQNVVEHSFLIYPIIISATAAGSGGSLSAGSYQYVAVYEWMDGQGQLHRSTPSVPFSVTTVNNDSVTVITTGLRATAKVGVMLQIYRTQVNQTTFFQETNFNGNGSLYTTGADSVSWPDTLSDAAIGGNPQLYTTGGVLENSAAPPCSAMTVHRNRLFLVDSTNPTTVWYSKQITTSAPVEFSALQTFLVDPKGGAVTALASLDDKLILFKADRVFMILGQGPDSTGNQNDFTDAILVNADTGCVTPKSIVTTPDGLMYLSPKGIYQLSRALQVTYIGAPVEEVVLTNTDDVNVSSGVLMPTLHQVRFALPNADNGDDIAVYDYLVGQWSTFTIDGGQAFLADSCLSRGTYYAIDAFNNVVIKETAGIFSDEGAAPFKMTLVTGWIKINGLQGFQRAYRMLLLGTYKSPHKLNVSVAYDYDSTIVQTTTFDVASDPAPYQFRVDFERQKCEAIQITISDSNQSGTGESFQLSGITLEIGVKPGTFRLPATKSGG